MQIHNLNNQASAMHLFLAEMRDHTIQKDRERFRQNLQKLGFIVAYELSKAFSFEEQMVFTPLGQAKAKISKVQPVIVTILRASLPFYNGFLEVFPQADSGFIGAYRASETKEALRVETNYVATRSLEGETLVIIDPMLATGTSLLDAINIICRRGTPKEIHIASVVAAPEGIKYISDNLSIPSHLWTCAVDEKLNDQAYIVPGLGDAGDLCFGPKL